MTVTAKLVLASGSPYRRELLNRLLLPFDVIPADIDEIRREGEDARALSMRLARDKALAVAENEPHAWVIGSDQTLTLGEEILGKPGNHENAVAQLTRLSGRAVRFYTSLCLIVPGREPRIEVVESNVSFRELETEEIERYLAREPAYDCAGSCKAEGLGIAMVKSINSDDPTALIGLPLIRLREMLSDAGLQIP